MRKEWEDIEFTFVEYKDTGISILSAVDDLQVCVALHFVLSVHAASPMWISS